MADSRFNADRSHMKPHTQKGAAMSLFAAIIGRALDDIEGKGTSSMSSEKRKEVREDAWEWIHTIRPGIDVQTCCDNIDRSILTVKRKARERKRRREDKQKDLSRQGRLESNIRDALRFIRERVEATGDFPRQTEIGEAIGLSEHSGSVYVQRLKTRGYVEGSGMDYRLTDKAFATTH